MRQIIAIALLSLYLLTSTDFSELLKLPQLAQHFKEHQEEQQLTFSEFVYEHYTKGDVFDADRDQDLKLPYKSLDFTHAVSFTVLPSITTIEFITTTDFAELKPPNRFYNACFSSDNFSTIWQPPQIV
ncbi:hypothetical protein [Flavobacterium tegetincola]|uniref:hypothetical protein n=1 Tax=Flavobacterium tegetincola TaxID=150172 RepID=UPI00040DA32B|nr:hypothetical protein [Flavobacterium tegetincola]